MEIKIVKICIVPTMFPKYKGDYYGSFVFDEVKILVKKGFEVHVVTQHNSGIPYEEIIDGIYVHRFRWFEPKEFKALVHFKGFVDYLRLITYVISLFFYLIYVIQKFNLDIIHAHSVIPTGFVGVIVAKILRKPVLITAHGMDVTNFENRPYFRRLLTFSLINCNKAIAVSRFLANKIKSFGTHQDNIIILRNAVNTKRFRPISNKSLFEHNKTNNVLILFVGYLDVFKGIFELIAAFSEIKKDNKKIKLMIVGTGPKENEIRTKIVGLNLGKSVILTGEISPSEIHKYYQSADIFVLPSYTDAGGPPLVVIEAMACGLPVIGTNVGGIPEGIEDGINGFIIHPKNVDELSEKLEILVNNKELRQKFGIKALETVDDEFNIEKKVEKLKVIYYELIQ